MFFVHPRSFWDINLYVIFHKSTPFTYISTSSDTLGKGRKHCGKRRKPFPTMFPKASFQNIVGKGENAGNTQLPDKAKFIRLPLY